MSGGKSHAELIINGQRIPRKRKTSGRSCRFKGGEDRKIMMGLDGSRDITACWFVSLKGMFGT